MEVRPAASRNERLRRLTALAVLCLGCQRQSAVSSAPAELPSSTPSPSAAAAGIASPRSAEPQVSLDGGAWTAGIVDKQAPAVGVALLRAVRAARHEGLDRVVLEFDGALPAYHIEYIDRPVRRCGSGDATALEGDGWLEIHLEPAAAHNEQGQPLLLAREQWPGLPIVREIELTCDFEAHVNIVLGVASPNRYRVLELSSPARLVVDIRHRR
jgi:hypothetical protein